ncbi:MAG: fibrobacter succinogenes major paralogous domain-containing protein, partial [Sulfurovum sp.]|nr:fibrobacter succinogenes major paralogous domain-containing protein [Sulfurovum sp.]
MKLYLQGLVVAIIAIVILDSCGVNTNGATAGDKGTLCNVVHLNTRYGCVKSKNTGRIWLDRNLGAIKVARTPFYSPSYGDYFQWGRPADGHQRSTSSTVGSAQASTTSPSSNRAFITVDTNTADWVDDGVDDNGALREVFLWKTNGMGICPEGYRVPTAAEWRAELNTSSQDMNNSALKLPLAGFRDGKTGKVNQAKSLRNDPNAVGYYLASDSSSQKLAKFLFLDQNRRGKIETKGRAYGYSVRCIEALKGEKAPVISGGSGKTPSGGSENVPSDDHNNTQDGATPINLNSITLGNIETAGDVDWFKIVIPSRGTLVVKTTGAIDTEGALYNASGSTPIAYDDDDGAGHNFKITQTVAAGTYYVEIKDRASGTGVYALSTRFTPISAPNTPVSDDYGNTASTARTISPTSTTSGNIETAGDEDYFKIVIPSAGTLVVKTTGFTDTDGSLFDARSNTPIATDNDSGSGRNFKISTFIHRAGTYYVMVKHRSPEATGNYKLVSEFTPDDHGSTPGHATVISPNSATQGRINSAGDVDWFKIVIPRRIIGTLTVNTTGTTDTQGVLYDARGTEIAFNDDNNASDHNFKILRSVTAGTYYVAVRHRDGSVTSGTYLLVAHFDDHGDTQETATPIVNLGDYISGSIETAGDVDWFKIVIDRTGTLNMGIAGQTSDDINVSLYSENGVYITSRDSSSFKISQSVTAGTYYVKVRHHSSTGTGDYGFATGFVSSAQSESALDPEPADTNSTADTNRTTSGAEATASGNNPNDDGNNRETARIISPTSTTSGNIETAGDVDYFTIKIPSAGTLVVKTTGFTDTNGSLLDANNTPIATDDNSGSERNFEISTFIQDAGTYYVMVKHRSPEATGNYKLVSEFTPDDHG